MRVKKSEKRVFEVESDLEDFVHSAHQDYQISDDHIWYRENTPLHNAVYNVIYFIFYIVSWVYAYLWLGVRFKNRRVLRDFVDEPYFVYGNHTQPFGDIAMTVLLNYPHKISAVMSPANMGIPVIGWILKNMNFLPVPKTDKQRAQYKDAMTRLVTNDGVSFIIYPEAHVWPYYTKIRDFTDTSMRYPVRYGTASFTSTVTYQRRVFGSKPKITVYVDGPFYPRDIRGDESAQKADLCKTIRKVMIERAKASTYSYVRYEEKDQPNRPAADKHTDQHNLGEERAR